MNQQRQKLAPNHRFANHSVSLKELTKNSYLKLDYMVVPPRMQLYIDYSAPFIKFI